MTETVIGLALGSGAAFGWAHIGVIEALEEMGLEPKVVCGTSIGALVGAAYITGELDALQDFARSMGIVGLMSYLDVTFSRGGLVVSEKIFERFRNPLTDQPIENLSQPFGAVATDLATGRETWLRAGDLLTALRASTAIPGIFPPVAIGHNWLVDGALVNPVPVSLCRALGADFVIAVALSSSRSALPRLAPPQPTPGSQAIATATPTAVQSARTQAWQDRLGALLDQTTQAIGSAFFAPKQATPSVMETLVGSIDIMQNRIMRSRLVGEPPDILIAPMLGRIGLLEFDRASELIKAGYQATRDLRPAIERALQQA